MNDKRTIYKVSSIIDILNHGSVRIIGKPSVRIRYDYDGIKDNQEFTILNRDIPKESADEIISWLKDYVSLDDIIYGLESNDLDIETFDIKKKAV